VVELIPDFIECGLDVLQSLQPAAAGMDLAALKREFGRDLCFHGSIDIQQTLPRGTPEDVREEVRRRMEAGKPGGAFIISTAHSLQPDVPLPNILALFDAYEGFGWYAHERNCPQ
jgi:uroporphyrinogen decarboxylase